MLRNIARLTPRLASTVAKASASRSAMVVPQLAMPALRFYSSSSAADAELVAALKSEKKVEEEVMKEEEKDAAYFTDFLHRQGFTLIEKPGQEEVQFVRQSGDETVRIYFSISDVINSDNLLDEVEEDGESQYEAESAAENDDVDDNFEAPIRLNIVVEKPAGAVGIEAVIQDDFVMVESLIPYDSAKLATDESPEADYKRRTSYQGPPFAVLDPSVQSAITAFLESRNINGDLALFITEYSSYRENQEYVRWLGKLAKVFE